jgi:hypothetical protein
VCFEEAPTFEFKRIIAFQQGQGQETSPDHILDIDAADNKSLDAASAIDMLLRTERTKQNLLDTAAMLAEEELVLACIYV